MVYVDDGFFGKLKRENPAEYEQMLAFNPGGRMSRPDDLQRQQSSCAARLHPLSMAPTSLVVDGSVTMTVEEVAAILKEHGQVIIKELVTRETMGQVVAELQPHIEATALGSNEGFGLKTRRTDRLIERSPTARSLVMHPLVQGLLHSALRHAHIVSAA